jgi:hypothetical protein
MNFKFFVQSWLRRFLPKKQIGWRVVDIGTRMIKCGYFVVGSDTFNEAGLKTIDIQDEGLLSSEEIGTSIARVLDQTEPGPVALLLPDALALSQVIDVPNIGSGREAARLEASIRSITGLSEGRFVHNSFPLKPFSPYRAPYWVTVAREEALNSQFTPLISQGLKIEFATTVGNALMAEFLYRHPQINHACIVDFGATQTTTGCLKDGQPRYLTSLPVGGEILVEALLEATGLTEFERMEKRLFSEDLFDHEVCGPALKKALNRWLSALIRQFSDWDEDSTNTAEAQSLPIFLYGGFSIVPGLLKALNEVSDSSYLFKAGVNKNGPPLDAITRPLSGAVLLATRQSQFRSSILPRSLARMRDRQKRLSQVRNGSRVIFCLLLFALILGSVERSQQAHSLEGKRQLVENSVAEADNAIQALAQRDQIGQQITPIADRWIRSIEIVETLRLLQSVRDEFDFGLQRFSDRGSFSNDIKSMDFPINRRPGRDSFSANNDGYESFKAPGFQTFIVEILIEGDSAKRLNQLRAIVIRLRDEPFFENVDRLVRFESNRVDTDNTSAVYAIALTLTGRPLQNHLNAAENDE